MIWISTLCLLCIAAWLFFNALNEKRWVEAHSHDESVASDEGLLGGFSLRTGTGHTGVDGKVSIDQENTRFARAVAKVKNQTTVWGDKLIESKVSEARIKDGEQRPASVREENTLFGRAVARVSSSSDRREQQFGEKMNPAGHHDGQADSNERSSEGLVARTTRKVANKSDEISQMVASGAKNLSQSLSDKRADSKDAGMFERAVTKVSGGMDKMDAKADSRRARTRSDADDRNTDPVARASSKVSETISEMSNRKVKDAGDNDGNLDKS